jgi:hypothetical protein
VPSRLNLGALLAAAEAAPPVGAVDAVGDTLAAALGATDVRFLIADYSGDSLIRLAHSAHAPSTRRTGRETADRVWLREPRTDERSRARRSKSSPPALTRCSSRR